MIINATDDNFETDVVEKSTEIPVVVDFWATWCPPCRALGPVLEGLAREFDGRFILAKVNTEEAPRSAAKFRVQSIPVVYGLRNGKVVDGFIGALPETQIRHWLDRFLPTQAEVLLARANSIVAANPVAAESLLRQVLKLDSRLAAAQIALGQLLLDRGREDESRQILAQLEARGFLEPEAEKLKAALEVKKIGGDGVNIAECRARVEKDPQNLSLQWELVQALAAESRFEEALPVALEIVQRDRGDLREKARHLMVDMFRLMPADSALVPEYRRKLSMALY